MSNLVFRAKAYVSYLVSSKKGILAHSPFVFDLANNVLYPKKGLKPFEYAIDVFGFKKKLARNHSIIDKSDFGTGTSKRIKTSALAKSSSVRSTYGKLLTRLVHFQKPENILELGTCLGVSSMYMFNGLSSGNLTSVEGCSETHKARTKVFKENGIKTSNKAEFVNHKFDDFFREREEAFDFVFIDGNHTYAATKRYFNKLWKKLPENGVIILDDIHWSEEMERAWGEIILENQHLISIDLFQFGLCFKKPQQAKEHFVLRY